MLGTCGQRSAVQGFELDLYGLGVQKHGLSSGGVSAVIRAGRLPKHGSDQEDLAFC